MKNIISILTLVITSLSVLRAQDMMKVRSGWNTIGALSTKELTQIRTEPPGIIISYYFGYTPSGYQIMDTLHKGEGYWVRISQAGLLIVDSTSGTSCPATVWYEGKTYNTVQIGNQCWLKENLDVETMITGSSEQTNNSTIEKYCYGNDTTKCSTYGGLYQWDEAMQYNTTEGTQGICPTGWHIPTLGELFHLAGFANGNSNALKAIGQGTGDGTGTNTSGFSALLSGERSGNGNFNYLGDYMYIWSSTEDNATYAYYLYLNTHGSNMNLYYYYKADGFSVRCVKD